MVIFDTILWISHSVDAINVYKTARIDAWISQFLFDCLLLIIFIILLFTMLSMLEAASEWALPPTANILYGIPRILNASASFHGLCGGTACTYEIPNAIFLARIYSLLKNPSWMWCSIAARVHKIRTAVYIPFNYTEGINDSDAEQHKTLFFSAFFFYFLFCQDEGKKTDYCESMRTHSVKWCCRMSVCVAHTDHIFHIPYRTICKRMPSS